MTSDARAAADSAAQKLDQWFQTLAPAEQRVIGEMVRAALIEGVESGGASELVGVAQGVVTDTVSGYNLPLFLSAISRQNTPGIVSSLGLSNSQLFTNYNRPVGGIEPSAP